MNYWPKAIIFWSSRCPRCWRSALARERTEHGRYFFSASCCFSSCSPTKLKPIYGIWNMTPPQTIYCWTCVVFYNLVLKGNNQLRLSFSWVYALCCSTTARTISSHAAYERKQIIYHFSRRVWKTSCNLQKPSHPYCPDSFDTSFLHAALENNKRERFSVVSTTRGGDAILPRTTINYVP